MSPLTAEQVLDHLAFEVPVGIGVRLDTQIISATVDGIEAFGIITTPDGQRWQVTVYRHDGA